MVRQMPKVQTVIPVISQAKGQNAYITSLPLGQAERDDVCGLFYGALFDSVPFLVCDDF